MDVAAVNAALLLIVLFAEPMSAGLRTVLSSSHVKPNEGLLQALASAHLGTPFSLVLVSMILLFVGFAVRDAYDYARGEKLKPIYADSALHLSEAASGSYLFHFAAMGCFAIFALFFLIPPPKTEQAVVIEFHETPLKDIEPVKAKKFSSENSSASHREKPVEKPTPKTSSASQTRTQPAHQAMREKTVTPPEKTTPIKQVVKEQSAKGEQTPVIKPVPRAFAPQPQAHVAPAPAPLTMAPKSVTPSAQANVTPMPTLAKAASTGAPNPLVAFVPHLSNAPGPTPMALNHSANSILGGAPSPAEAKRGSSSSTIGNGPPAPVSAASSNTNSMNPSPVPGAHTGNPGQPTGTDSATRPTKIASLRPDGLGSVQPAVGPAGPSSVPHIDKRGIDNAPGRGKGDEDIKISPDFGPYMAELQRRIKRNWQPPKDPNSRQVVVEFTIFKSGELGSVHISRSSGLSVNDQAAISAIRAAAPFMPLPKHADDSVDIQFTFDYRVFGGHANF